MEKNGVDVGGTVSNKHSPEVLLDLGSIPDDRAEVQVFCATLCTCEYIIFPFFWLTKVTIYIRPW